jgi:drug/metabolite transporter (DMT)-like permease
LYLFALKRWTATGISYSFVLYPIVTVVLAAVLIDETITLLFLGGAAVVLTGVTVGALLPQKKPG